MSVRGTRAWTLRTKLLASIVALYLLVTLITGAATVLSSRSAQLGQIDSSLRNAATAIRGDGDGGPGRGEPPPSIGLGQLTCTLGEDGTIRSRSIDGRIVSSCYVSGTDGARTTISQAQIQPLVGMSDSGLPITVTLGGADYRVVTAEHIDFVRGTDGSVDQELLTEIRGLPLAPVQRSVTTLVRTVAVVGLLGLLLLTAAAWWLVRRNLAPLRRVARTAVRVAQQPLSRGDVRTAERVDDADTDPHTEVGQVGSALNELLEHVDTSLAARHRSEMQVRQFVADASHELRTPLASIKGYAELSRREQQPVPEAITHALGRIEAESGRMTALVEDLLLLARLDAGRPLAREPVDLTMVVMETVSDARAAGPDHRWMLDLPEEPCEVVGDEARVRQVLINLLANARKHTPPGTVVTTAVRSTPEGAELTVSDTGPGIPAELQPRVFERFARGDAARHRTDGSTGLGLAIVQAVVAAHGGRVSVSSEPGQTLIRVALPHTAPEPRPTLAGGSQEQA